MMKIATILMLIFFSAGAFAHGGVDHSKEEDDQSNEWALEEESEKTTEQRKKLVEIGETYARSIKPIFEKKCFDCHVGKESKPWYYSIPGISHYIDSEIKESKKHLNMSQDFPFISHASPQEDLEEIAEVVNEGAMPPWLYLTMHSENNLTQKEKDLVLSWVESSLKKMKGDK